MQTYLFMKTCNIDILSETKASKAAMINLHKCEHFTLFLLLLAPHSKYQTELCSLHSLTHYTSLDSASDASKTDN